LSTILVNIIDKKYSAPERPAVPYCSMMDARAKTMVQLQAGQFQALLLQLQ
jgi:hypothetical protein